MHFISIFSRISCCLTASLIFVSGAVLADPPGAPGYDQASGYHHEYYANGGTSGATTTTTTTTTTSNTATNTVTSNYSGNDNDSDDNATHYHYTPPVRVTTPYSVIPVDPRDSSPSSAVLSIVTGVRNATMTAVSVAQTAAARVVNTTYALVQPHYEAYQAGVNAEKMEVAHIVGAMDGSQFDDQSLQRANDNGVYNNYSSRGLDPAKQLVPSGPMQRITHANPMPFAGWDATDITAVDELFRAGEIQVYAPGEITSSNGVRVLGTAYNHLSRQQILGLNNSVFAQGNVDMTKFGMPADLARQVGGFSESSTFGGSISGSLIVMKKDNLPVGLNYADTIIHELQHAADFAMTNIAQDRMTDPSLDSAQQYIATMAYGSGQLNETESFDAIAVNSNYANRYKELRGYSVTPANMETLAQHIAQGTNVSNPGAPFPSMPIAQARVLANQLVNSYTLQKIDRDFNALLDDMGQ